MSFNVKDVIKKIFQEHTKILDDWCKAYLSKEYEIGNDIHPGCFTIQQRKVKNPNNFGWDYTIVPNDQEFGFMVKWKSREEEIPPKDGTKFLAYVNICIKENTVNLPGIFKKEYRICWFEDKFWRSYDQEKGYQILNWALLPSPPIKTPRWEKLGWCCENLYNFYMPKYSESNNPGVLMGDDNSLFVGNITERINICPWCGENINNE